MDEISNSVISRSVVTDVAPMVSAPRPLGSRGLNRLWSFTRHGRKFFAKGLAPEYAGDLRARAMLRKEFDLAARLEHPAIVRALSWESLPGAGECIVMEWIEGETLGKWLQGAPSLSDRTRVARDICDALVYAAESGVSHRDLKPDNIMITRTGRRVKIIDFGLGDSDDFALLKQTVATRGFGAPELQEEPVACGPEADVYSFGRILEFMNLKVRYRGIIKSCLRTDVSRRPGMAEVWRRMQRADAVVRNIPLMAVSLVAVLSVTFGTVALLSGRQGEGRTDSPADAALPRDTVYVTTAPNVKTDTIFLERPDEHGSAQGAPAAESKIPPAGISPTDGAESRRIPKASDATSAAYDRAVAKIDALSRQYEGAYKTDDMQKKMDLANRYRNQTTEITKEFKKELIAAGERQVDIHTYINALYTYIAESNPFVPAAADLNTTKPRPNEEEALK